MKTKPTSTFRTNFLHILKRFFINLLCNLYWYITLLFSEGWGSQTSNDFQQRGPGSKTSRTGRKTETGSGETTTWERGSAEARERRVWTTATTEGGARGGEKATGRTEKVGANFVLRNFLPHWLYTYLYTLYSWNLSVLILYVYCRIIQNYKIQYLGGLSIF